MEQHNDFEDLNKSTIYYRDLKKSEEYTFAEFDPVEKLKETPNMAMLITSKRRTGKSVLMKDLCQKIHKWYDQCYVFSMTAEYQPDLFNYVDEGCVYNSFDEDKLNEIWDTQKNHVLKIEAQGKKKEKDANKIMILFDDVISDPRVKKSEILNRLAVMGRHIMIGYILISQTITGVPPIIRTNADCAIAFYLDSCANRETYASEYLSTESKRLGVMIFNKI